MLWLQKGDIGRRTGEYRYSKMVQRKEGVRFYCSGRWRRRFICPSLGNPVGGRNTPCSRPEGRIRDWERRKGPSLRGQSAALLKLNIILSNPRIPFFHPRERYGNRDINYRQVRSSCHCPLRSLDPTVENWSRYRYLLSEGQKECISVSPSWF